jgi:hypothetical protein
MSVTYKENLKFKKNLKMLVALAFVRDSSIKYLKTLSLDYFLNSNTDEYIIHMLLYFEKIYIKNMTYKRLNVDN